MLVETRRPGSLRQMRIAILTQNAADAERIEQDLGALGGARIDRVDGATGLAGWAKTEPGVAIVRVGQDRLTELAMAVRAVQDTGALVLALLPKVGEGPTTGEALAAGAAEVCRSDAHPAALRNRIGVLHELIRTRAALWQARDGRQQAAAVDPLTKLINRPAFLARLDAEIARARRTDRPLVVGLLDVDRLKEINARHGTAQGDRVLSAVADRAREVLREMDVAGRLGGTEFAFCLPDAALAGGAAVLDRLRRKLSALAFPLPRGSLSVTVSIGVTALELGDEDASDLINRADRALLRAKDLGRDRVERA